MLVRFSDPMRRDIEATIRARIGETRVLDVYAVAGEVQNRFVDENVALEDIVTLVAKLATQSGCALELRSSDMSLN